MAISNNDYAESELAYTNDFYIYAYKYMKPPSLRISSFDLSRCASQGKIKLIGTLSQVIYDQIVFELPFSYPSSRVKCTIDPTYVTEDVDISCKILKTKKFSSFRSFVVEPRLLKKKRKEILFIESATYDYGSEMRCENFNELKLKRAKARKSSSFSFLQVGRSSRPGYMFFMALTRRSEEVSFTTTTYEVSVIVDISEATSGRLRALEQTKELDRNVTCDVGSTTGNSGVLNCRPDSGTSLTPLKLNLPSTNISGIPEDVPVQTNPNPDYSKNETLKAVDSLAVVTITNVSSNNCSVNGSFVIDANSTKQFDWTKKTNVSISFSTPDSSGLCIINVLSDKRTLKMDCENTESFTASEIIIGSQVVYDDDDVTQIFRIAQDYTAPVQFACAISDRSLRIAFSSLTNATNTTIDTSANATIGTDSNDGTSSPGSTDSNSMNSRFSRVNSSKGLGGGAIAGIVISCVVVVAIVGVLIALIQKGAFAGASAAAAASSANDGLDNTATVNQFKMNNINQM